LDTFGAVEKDEMRALVMRGSPWTAEERAAVLDYCMSDVDALARLVPAMLPRIDLPRALLRGRYMSAAARMEHNGVPIDVPMLDKLRRYWVPIQEKLIERIDADYGVFDGRTFKLDRFEVHAPAFRGHDLKADGSTWATILSARWRGYIRPYHRCVNFEARSLIYDSTIWPSDVTAAIARSCRHFGRAPAATSRAIHVSFSGPASGLDR
jgi:hypothetical protein